MFILQNYVSLSWYWKEIIRSRKTCVSLYKVKYQRRYSLPLLNMESCVFHLMKAKSKVFCRQWKQTKANHNNTVRWKKSTRSKRTIHELSNASHFIVNILKKYLTKSNILSPVSKGGRTQSPSVSRKWMQSEIKHDKALVFLRLYVWIVLWSSYIVRTTFLYAVTCVRDNTQLCSNSFVSPTIYLDLELITNFR